MFENHNYTIFNTEYWTPMKLLNKTRLTLALFGALISSAQAEDIDPEIFMNQFDHLKDVYHSEDVPFDQIQKAQGVIVLRRLVNEEAYETITCYGAGAKYVNNYLTAPLLLNVSGANSDAVILLMDDKAMQLLTGEQNDLSALMGNDKAAPSVLIYSQAKDIGHVKISPNNPYNQEIYGTSTPAKIMAITPADGIKDITVRTTANAFINAIPVND